jgi:hypothetical protein
MGRLQVSAQLDAEPAEYIDYRDFSIGHQMPRTFRTGPGCTDSPSLTMLNFAERHARPWQEDDVVLFPEPHQQRELVRASERKMTKTTNWTTS